MDLRTAFIIRKINRHLAIKKYLTIFCYFLIVISCLTYLFYIINKPTKKYKLINDYQKNPQKYQVEKMMVNPRIKFLHSDGNIYNIKAKRAMHKDNQEVTLFDVSAIGEMGNVSAGRLVINEDGDHLVFSQKPVVIINKAK